ncbi:hypothetical protein SAPIO_CDS8750 [Scedosporium apiospermum]|uniref:Uncharacterized protein n=1 Tax=Pseudallescheria apiosperma TaxID=563466 RepID=A0A084FYS9_PSEDA|nr:uncharacterized protein SAPIO_CDS8750 [Scedosporium apiospermum]KEZ40241.1 hypothetical protein SAPIO_CDS8750 [Scedosporium apiospermum]
MSFKTVARIWTGRRLEKLRKWLASQTTIQERGSYPLQEQNSSDKQTDACDGKSQGSTLSAASYDSGYHSLTLMPSIRENKEDSEPTPPVRKKFRVYEKEIPEAAQLRLYDWKVLFTRQLRELLDNYHSPGADLSMKLKYLGPSEAEAKLYLIFQCDHCVVKPLKKFLDQPHVKVQFQSQFEYLIVSREPKRLAASGCVNVYSHIPNLEDRDTLCGTPILVRNLDGPAMATIGGVVLVTTESRKYLCCMTAGHVVTKLFCSDHRSSTCRHKAASSSVETRIAIQDENGEIDLNLDDFEAADLETANQEWSHLVGHVAHLPSEASRQSTNLDWALVELLHIKYLPNFVQLTSASKLPLLSMGVLAPHLSNPVVVVLTSRRGNLNGSIRRRGTSFLSSGSEAFTTVYDLILDSGLRLSPGDSGSWVVDFVTGQVYGHVIAIDIFGEAYVVPLDATLQDMKQRLPATEITLPSEAEFQALSNATLANGMSEDNSPSADSGMQQLATQSEASRSGHGGSKFWLSLIFVYTQPLFCLELQQDELLF